MLSSHSQGKMSSFHMILLIILHAYCRMNSTDFEEPPWPLPFARIMSGEWSRRGEIVEVVLILCKREAHFTQPHCWMWRGSNRIATVSSVTSDTTWEWQHGDNHFHGYYSQMDKWQLEAVTQWGYVSFTVGVSVSYHLRQPLQPHIMLYSAGIADLQLRSRRVTAIDYLWQRELVLT